MIVDRGTESSAHNHHAVPRHRDIGRNDLADRLLFHHILELLGGLESGNIVGRNMHGGVLRDIAASLLGSSLQLERAETAEIDILTFYHIVLNGIHQFLDSDMNSVSVDTSSGINFANNFCFGHNKSIFNYLELQK